MFKIKSSPKVSLPLNAVGNFALKLGHPRNHELIAKLLTACSVYFVRIVALFFRNTCRLMFLDETVIDKSVDITRCVVDS